VISSQTQSANESTALSTCCGINQFSTYGSGDSQNCFQYCNISTGTQQSTVQSCLASALGNQSNSLFCFSAPAKTSAAEIVQARGASWTALGTVGIMVGAWVLGLEGW
jgi:hypothetical protein